MLRIDRARVVEPAELKSDGIRKELERARKFFGSRSALARQSRFRFDSKVVDLSVIASLKSLFHSKCAYCEQGIPDAELSSFDRFRPAYGALGVEGKASPQHYWWLGFDWRNLYLACPECNRRKGNRFPLLNKRGAKLASWANLVDVEQRLLLDPCLDQPGEHLDFEADGTVKGRTECGIITIEVLALNRTSLIAQRGSAASRVAGLVDAVLSDPDFRKRGRLTKAILLLPTVRGLRKSLAPSESFSQCLRQRAACLLLEADADQAAITLGLKDIVEVLNTTPPMLQNEVPKVERHGVKQTTYLFNRQIESVSVRNVAGIEDLELLGRFVEEPDAPKSGGSTPALVMLGENGCGKSSLLRAIAIALNASAVREDPAWKEHARRLVGPFDSVASIEVGLSGEASRRRVVIGANGSVTRTDADGPDADVLLVAYGSTRLPGPHSSEEVSTQMCIGNLFNPFQPILDLELWLRPKDGLKFDRVANALREILPVGTDAAFGRSRSGDGAIWITSAMLGQRIPLAHLSDGYRSVLGLVAHLMAVLEGTWERPEDAEAIVLIDELENHLHPRWRMRILRALRRAYPRVQFIVTTHDPLCLKGAENGEVIVLRRVEGKVVALTDLPPVSGLRVDQLLQSDYFGLNTVLDPDVEERQTRYLSLKKLPSKTTAQKAELGRLSLEIEQRLTDLDPTTTFIGRDRREQLMLEAIDQGLAKINAATTSQKIKQFRRQTINEAARLFEAAVAAVPGTRLRR